VHIIGFIIRKYDFPTLYFPLEVCLLTGVNKICLVFLTFFKSDSGKISTENVH